MRKLLEDIIQLPGISYADVRVEERENVTIVFRGKELESVKKNFEKGGIVRVFVNGNWGILSVNTIDSSTKDMAIKLSRNIRRLPRREKSLYLLPSLEKRITITEEEDPRKIPLEKKKDLLEKYNEIMLSGKNIVSTNAIYQDLFVRKIFLSSEGRFLQEERGYAGIGLTAIAKDGNNIQTYTESFGKRKGFEFLENREEIAEKVAKIASDLLKAETVDAGIYTVVIDPLLAGVFIHEAFGHLSEGDHIQGNEKLKDLMRIGRRYGIEALNVVDDGTLQGERGTISFDEEGIEAKKTHLIFQGILSAHLNSRETAYELTEAPTGNARSISYRYPPIVRMTNTYIEPGTSKKEELFDVKKGLYIVGTRGGMTELETFTFSSQYAYFLEKGKKKKLLKNVTLSGNVFYTLRNIEAIADDLEIYGGIGGCGKGEQAPLPVGLGGPHVRIKNVTIGGK